MLFEDTLTKTPDTPLLQVDGLTRPGLAPVSLTLAAGAIAAVSGPSGAGKSLLLRAIADLDPNDGAVVADGIERRSVPAPTWRRNVAYLPAESGWWADTVGQHMADPAGARDQAVRLGLSADAVDWQVARLSTGEKQRLALIRALQGAPRVLLLDEPTSGLDPAATQKVEAMIRDACDAGACAVVVSHDADQVSRLQATRYRIENGVLSAEDAPS